MMVNFLRIWLPASLVVHLLLFIVLQHLPPLPAATPPEQLLRVRMTTASVEPPAPPPAQVTPATVKPPAPKPIPPPRRTMPTRVKPVVRPPQRVAELTPHDNTAIGRDRTSTRDPHLPTGGGNNPDTPSGDLPKFTSETTRNPHEGWADQPDAASAGMNSLGTVRLAPVPGNGLTGGLSGKQGTSTALRPGASGLADRDGGSAGSQGGTGRPFAGLDLGGNEGMLPGLTPDIINGSGRAKWGEQPGRAGGTGSGSGGMMARGPRRATPFGSTLTGPDGTSIGLRPGGAPNMPGQPRNGGGITGEPGTPFGGAGTDDGVRDIAAASGGAPRGVPGAGDRPGAGGGPGTGIGGHGPQRGKPSYGASALGGPTPGYPTVAVAEGLSGTVKLEVFLDRNANVTRIAFLQRSYSDALDNEAKFALKKWRYRAAMKNGVATASSIKFLVRFELDKDPKVEVLP